MGHSSSQGSSEPPIASSDFNGRAPSSAWEAVPLSGSPQHVVWIWYKPPTVPTGLIVQIPAELYRTHPQPQQLTMRNILHAAGVDPQSVAQWQIYGTAFEAQQGRAAVLDQAIPAPVAGADPNMIVWMNQANPQSVVAATVSAGGPTVSGSMESTFAQIESEWHASLIIEVKLQSLRKQMSEILIRLNSLNRDLTADEGLYGDRQDKSDWQDARRWLRDVAARVLKCIKAHDIGDTSSAGSRKWFEQTYEQCIVPRQPFDGAELAQRQYESYRKSLQQLQTQMTSTLTSATTDGERRAQQVLSRIATKVRTEKSKRGTRGG